MVCRSFAGNGGQNPNATASGPAGPPPAGQPLPPPRSHMAAHLATGRLDLRPAVQAEPVPLPAQMSQSVPVPVADAAPPVPPTPRVEDRESFSSGSNPYQVNVNDISAPNVPVGRPPEQPSMAPAAMAAAATAAAATAAAAAATTAAATTTAATPWNHRVLH